MKTSLLYSLVALLPLTSAFSAKAEVPISPAPSPTPSASPSGSTDSRMSVSELEARIERAYLRADSELLAPAVAQLDADLAVHPNDAASLYLRGFASFAQGCVARAQDDKALFEKCLTAAGETLAKVKGAPWEAEAQALHSYLLGQLIGSKGPAAGMTLGPKSGALLAKAMAAAPTNPRVQLFQGVSLMNT